MGHLDERARLTGKTVVVAGGAMGLGRAAVLDLARCGCSLAICDRDDAALKDTVKEARQVGTPETVVLARTLDVREDDALKAFFADAEGELAHVDVLVNVVGGTFRSEFSDVNAKGVDRLIATNFTWMVRSISHCLAALKKSRDGASVVLVTSIEGHRAAPGFAVYGAMKAALAHLARTLATELGPKGIRINCIAPDFIPTEGLNKVAATTGSAGAIAASKKHGDSGDALTIPLGRKGDLEDFGNCVLFLASELSSYITGTTIHLDGGALASSGWMNWPDEGFTARPPAWVLETFR